MSDFFVVFLLVVLNGFFAMSEIAVLTSRKSRLRQMAKSSRRARRALDLADHPESFLSSVQVWITLLALVTGYFGGESLGGKLAEPVAHAIPLLAHYSEWIGFALGFLITFFFYGVI